MVGPCSNPSWSAGNGEADPDHFTYCKECLPNYLPHQYLWHRGHQKELSRRSNNLLDRNVQRNEKLIMKVGVKSNVVLHRKCTVMFLQSVSIEMFM